MAKPKILLQLNAEASSLILLKEDPDVAMEAATKQYVDNSGGVFYAIHGITTYAEIVEAFNKGKGVKALYSNTSLHVYIFDLVTRPTGSNTLYFAANNTNLNVSDLGMSKHYMYITSTNTWSVSSTYYNNISSSLLQTSAATPLSSDVRYHRPILTSTNPPSSTDGEVGDIWIQYST